MKSLRVLECLSSKTVNEKGSSFADQDNTQLVEMALKFNPWESIKDLIKKQRRI